MSIFNRFFGKKNNPTVDSDINKIPQFGIK